MARQFLQISSAKLAALCVVVTQHPPAPRVVRVEVMRSQEAHVLSALVHKRTMEVCQKVEIVWIRPNVPPASSVAQMRRALKVKPAHLFHSSS